MYRVPIESIGKKSEMRQKGKISELSCGFGGGVEALKRMGAESMGLSDSEIQEIVTDWRTANPRICGLWRMFNDTAIAAIKDKTAYKINKNVIIGFKSGI